MSDPARPGLPDTCVFHVWGCRGSRNLEIGRSRIGRCTSCYSLIAGDELIVFDAGRGLSSLSVAMSRDPRYQNVRSVTILLSHAHMDHWEGLKDADWFWLKDKPLDITLLGPAEAVETARVAFAHPSYVPLEQLTSGSNVRFRAEVLHAGEQRDLGSFVLTTSPLNHYSGMGTTKRCLDTIGFRLSLASGPVVAYLSDHEPGTDLLVNESLLTAGASLILVDAHYLNVADHAFGHGSVEHAARLARKLPDTVVIAGHTGSLLADEEIIAAVLRHAAGIDNCRIAREGDSYRWNSREGKFAGAHYARARKTVGGAAPAAEIDILKHELRIPVHRILSYCDLLRQEMEEAKDRTYIDDVRTVQKAADELLFLLERTGQQEERVPSEPASAASPGAPDSPALPGTGSESELGASPSSGAPGRILIVSHDEATLDVLSRLLAGKGYRVTVATEGRQAIDNVERQSYDLALLEADMPSISGLDVVHALRKTRGKTDLPIILLLSSEQRSQYEEALRSGANDCTARPLDFPILLARVESLVALRKAVALSCRLEQQLSGSSRDRTSESQGQ